MYKLYDSQLKDLMLFMFTSQAQYRQSKKRYVDFINWLLNAVYGLNRLSSAKIWLLIQ